MLASFLVVFNHVRFPGELDGFLNCLCMFAVPMFFATTGYFNYGATTQQVKRRFWHIAKLNIAADLFHIIWTCLRIELRGGSTIAYLRAAVPDLDELLWWIILHKNSFLGHLWYLAAVGACYVVYWIYIQFFGDKKVDHRPLYALGLILFVIYFTRAIVLPVAGVETGGYYNGWFLGLPMFLMGMFFRQYQEQIFTNYRLTTKKLLLFTAAGIGISVLQWKVLDLSGAPFGLPFGSAALMLLLISKPSLSHAPKWLSDHIIPKFAMWSTGIYLFHLTLSQVYDVFIHDGMIVKYGEHTADYIRPLLVLVISFAFAVLWEQACALLLRIKKSRAKISP